MLVKKLELSTSLIRQLFIYSITGLTINLLGFLLYLGVAGLVGNPKIAMTILYILGAVLGFLFNRRYTFLYSGRISDAGVRYVMVQGLGYLINLCLLLVFVDWLKFPHQIIQAVAIFVVAIFIFVSLKVFVFNQEMERKGAML